MDVGARQYSTIKSIFALLTVNFLALSTAEYVHRHRHGIQSKTYEHPRFGGSSIRYCAFNQYFDDREGRCLIIPGGGIAISIDEDTTCSTEALRGHPYRSRNYYICRKSNTILAECGRGKRFENRLKRCTIDVRPSIDEDYDSHHRPYDHLHLPACTRSGRFPVPQDNCTSFYTCTSNGFRFFRSIHKCPESTGFDPFEEICTTERACSNDELVSTTATDDRAEIFESTPGIIVTTAEGPSVDEALLIHTLKGNYSLNKSTMRFTTITASPSPSTSGYDESKNSVSFVPPDTFTTERITTATSLADSTGEVVGIARATRPTTEVYERGGETSTTYVHSIGWLDETNTSERSPITVSTSQIVDTSTANSVLSDDESTVNTSGTIGGIFYNKYSDDYVTLRSDNTVRQETKNDGATDTTVTISTNTEINEFTDQNTVDDLRSRMRDETRTSEANELGIGLQVSYSTESSMDNASEKWLFDKNFEGSTSTTADEIPRSEITERDLGTSPPVLFSDATSDATTRDIQYKEVESITSPSGISSIDLSSAFTEGSDIKSTPERITLYDVVTLTTPVDSYASTGKVSWKSLSNDEMVGTSIGPTEIVDSTPITLTSLTPQNNVATSIQESNWTTEEESTIADRYKGSFNSFSTPSPDNEELTTADMQSAMSTTEQVHISEVTEKVGAHSGIVWKSSSTDDLFTSIEQHQSTTGENTDSPFTYTSQSATSQFDVDQTVEDSASGMSFAFSTSSITPFPSSEPSQFEDGLAQGSTSNSGGYQTTVEPSTGFTNSLSTTMPSSSD